MNYTTPSGFRDVLADEAEAREAIVRRVQDCFARAGYVPIETPTLENMEVMKAGGRFPASPFKFFDAQGDLVTMRPDVTLQVARICATRLQGVEGPFRFRYTQRVFREREGLLGADAREKKQIGIECVGMGGPEADAEVIGLFARAMQAAGVDDYKLSLATVGVLRALLAASGAPEAWKGQVLESFHASNFVELDQLCDQDACQGSEFAGAIARLARIRGGREAIEEVRSLVGPLGCADALDEFKRTYELLEAAVRKLHAKGGK